MALISISTMLYEVRLFQLISFQNEIVTNSESFDQAANLTLLRSLVVTFSALEISLIIKYYKDKLLLHQLKTDTVRQNGKILSFNFSVSIFCSRYRKSLLLDILLHLMICPPGVNISFTMKQEGRYRLKYTWDMICSSISLMRLHVMS